MDSAKTPKPASNLSHCIESERKRQDQTVYMMAKAMGIDRNTYTRKLKSHNGFSDLEICRALRHLRLVVYVTTSRIEPLEI